MDAHECVVLRGDAVHECEMFCATDRSVDRRLEDTVIGRQRAGRAPFHRAACAAVGHQIGDGDHRESVTRGEIPDVCPAEHRAPVGADEFADETGRFETGCGAEVHGCLGVSATLQDPARSGAQWHHVARPGEVCRTDLAVGKGADGPGPVGRADPGRDTDRGIDADGERGAEGVGRVVDHRGQFQCGNTIRGHRDAQEAGGALEEEGDVVDVGELCRHHEIGLVLAVGVVDDDHRTPEAELVETPFDGGGAVRGHPVLVAHRCARNPWNSERWKINGSLAAGTPRASTRPTTSS